MKKLIKNLLLILLCVPSTVFAASIEISCPTSVTVGDNISCTVTGYHTSLAGLRATVNFSGMTYVSSNNLTDSNMFVVSNTEMDGAFDIATNSKTLANYTFKAENEGTATININCQEIIDGNDFSSVSCSTTSKSIIINKKPTEIIKPTPNVPSTNKNNDATLKGIELSVGKINFKSEQYNYEIEVDYNIDNITITPLRNDNKATYKIEGDTALKVGNNTIKINVTAEDGKTRKTYTLNVIRKNKILSSNNTIKNITINNYDLKFNSDKKEYSLTISNENSLTINVELEDENAQFEIVGNENLNNGSVIKINVTAENGKINTYIININTAKNTARFLRIGLIISILLNISLLSFLIYILKMRRKSQV